MTEIILLQSFRAFDIPTWVTLCQDSARKLAADRGWTYRWMGDELFDFAPAWAKAACGSDVWRLSDICRLEWICAELERGAEVVIWADIDMLFFEPRNIALDLSCDHGFSHEIFADANGLQQGVNNALMFFRNGSPMLRAYREACIARLASGDAQARTALGPDLLRGLGVAPENVIHGCGILNVRMMNMMLTHPQQRLPAMLPSPIGAANLCLNERRFFTGAALGAYDGLVETSARTLLARAGASV